MERKHIPEMENRLIILYALRRLGPITGMQLLQAMTEADLMNYITMQLALSEMEGQGQLLRRAYPAGDLLEITPEGDFVLDSYVSRIPASRRERMDGLLAYWQARFSLELMAPAEAIALADGRTALHLRLLDSAATVMDLMLYLPQGQTLDCIARRWPLCVQDAYATVLSHLTATYDPAAPMPPEEDTPDVHPGGEDEYLLTLTDDAHAPTIDLMMALPDEHLARCSALVWPKEAAAIRADLLTALWAALDG